MLPTKTKCTKTTKIYQNIKKVTFPMYIQICNILLDSLGGRVFKTLTNII